MESLQDRINKYLSIVPTRYADSELVNIDVLEDAKIVYVQLIYNSDKPTYNCCDNRVSLNYIDWTTTKLIIKDSDINTFAEVQYMVLSGKYGVASLSNMTLNEIQFVEDTDDE